MQMFTGVLSPKGKMGRKKRVSQFREMLRWNLEKYPQLWQNSSVSTDVASTFVRSLVPMMNIILQVN
jgi:hypothetical protein